MSNATDRANKALEALAYAAVDVLQKRAAATASAKLAGDDAAAQGLSEAAFKGAQDEVDASAAAVLQEKATIVSATNS